MGEGRPGHFRAASPEHVGRAYSWEAVEEDAALSPIRAGILRSPTCSRLAISQWPGRHAPLLFDEPFSFKQDGIADLPFAVGIDLHNPPLQGTCGEP